MAAQVTAPEVSQEVAALYARSGERAYQLASILTGEAAAAEDVVQEAFLRLVGRLSQLESHEALDGYLLRVVRNLALNANRKQKNAARALEQAPILEPAGGPGPHEPEERAALERALLELPPEQREVVHLRVWEGLAFAEIAARTDAPLGTVHSRYRYAMERLRELLGRPR